MDEQSAVLKDAGDRPHPIRVELPFGTAFFSLSHVMLLRGCMLKLTCEMHQQNH